MLKEIETGTDLGTVFFNPAQITHMHKDLSGDHATGEFTAVWLTNGRVVSVEGTPRQVADELFSSID